MTKTSTFNRETLIQAYVEAGWALTPEVNKRAFLENWPNTPYDPLASAEDFPADYGVVLRDCDLVLDIDPRNFFVGPPEERIPYDSWGEFTKLFGGFEDAYKVLTGGGGWHIYLKKPEGTKVRKRCVVRDENGKSIDKFPGIEFLSKGSKVTGPFSFPSSSKHEYRVVSGTPFDTPMAPVELLEEIVFVEDHFKAAGTGEYIDDQPNRARFSKYLIRSAPPSILGGGSDGAMFKIFAYGRDLGLSPETAYDIVMSDYVPTKTRPQADASWVKTKCEAAYRYASGNIGSKHPSMQFAKYLNDMDGAVDYASAAKKYGLIFKYTEKNVLKPREFVNLVSLMRLPDLCDHVNPVYNRLRYNEFNSEIEFIEPPEWRLNRFESVCQLEDADIVQLLYNFEGPLNYKVGAKETLWDACKKIAYDNSYNPVTSYLDGLSWDGIPRLDKMLTTYCGVLDNEYTRAVGAKTILGAVARAYNPGCQFDYMLVLEGAQGLRKTTFVKTLGGEFATSIGKTDVSSKDVKMLISKSWIIEFPEMATMNRSDVEGLKAFITDRWDDFREPYAKSTKKIPRHSIFIGSINPSSEGTYLKDTTGNRRFWPVSVTRTIDIDALELDRDQLFAEAVVRFRAGEDLYLNHKTEMIAKSEQAKRSVLDPWVETITGWLANNNKLTAGTTVSFTEISSGALGLKATDNNPFNKSRIENVMVGVLKWSSRNVIVNGQVKRVYTKQEIFDF